MNDYRGPGVLIGARPFAFDAQGNEFDLKAAHVKPGVWIGANSIIDCGTERETVVEAGTRIDRLVHVGHACIIGKNVTLCSGVTIAGFTVLEDDVYVGIGALLRNRIRVGEGAIIGMGAVVVKDVPPGVVVVGNPARFLKLRHGAAWYDDKIHTDKLGRLCPTALARATWCPKQQRWRA